MKNISFSDSKADEYFKNNISNLVSFVNSKGVAKFSYFLDERLQGLAASILKKEKCTNYLFFGGIDDCERKLLGVFPDFIQASEEKFPIEALKASFSNKVSISHRDCLGSLMGLNLKREAVGDIIIENESAIIFVTKEISQFVLQSLDKIGRTAVSVSRCEAFGISVGEKKYQEITGTVPSLRLDCIVAMLINKSRTIATEYISAGRVSVNHFEQTNNSKVVCPDDVIAIRGLGKFTLTSEIKKTKKDRFFVTLNKRI